MTNYVVRSGDMCQIVSAENPTDAAVLALKQTKAEWFGIIMEIKVQGTTDPGNETFYALTERMIELAK